MLLRLRMKLCKKRISLFQFVHLELVLHLICPSSRELLLSYKSIKSLSPLPSLYLFAVLDLLKDKCCNVRVQTCCTSRGCKCLHSLTLNHSEPIALDLI
jgi:hypothetical protein